MFFLGGYWSESQAQFSDSFQRLALSYKKAELLYNQENYKEAEPLFLNLTKYDSFKNPSWYRLACIAQHQHQPTSALAYTQNIDHIDSHDHYLLFKASILKELKENVEAGKCYEKSIHFHPNYWTRYRDAADCYKYASDKKYLYQICQRWEKQFQIRPEIANYYFIYFLSTKQVDSILNLSERLVTKYPSNSKILRQYIDICTEYNQQNRLATFLNRLNPTTTNLPDKTQLLLAEIQLLNTKNPSQKEAWYQTHRSEMLNLVLNRSEYAEGIGKLYNFAFSFETNIDTLQIAMSNYEKFAKHDPTSAEQRESYALRVFDLGGIAKSIPLLETASKDYSPKIDKIYKALIFSYIWLKDSSKLNSTLNSMSELFPFLPVAEYQKLSKMLLSESSLNNPEIIASNDPFVHLLYGWLAYKTNQFQLCINSWSKIKIDQLCPILYESAAQAAESISQPSLALKYYKCGFDLGFISKTVYYQKQKLLQK